MEGANDLPNSEDTSCSSTGSFQIKKEQLEDIDIELDALHHSIDIKDEGSSGLEAEPDEEYKVQIIQRRECELSQGKQFACQICRREFDREDHLDGHIRTHTGERPFTCEICHQSFAQKGSLTVHFRNHTEEKPFVCQICQKQFSYKTSLINHSRIHMGERPYVCQICRKQFTQNGALKRHFKNHNVKLPSSCTSLSVSD